MRAAWAEKFRRHWLWWLAAGLVVLLLALLHWRIALSERLFPDPRLNRQLQQADVALHRGELSRADGRGAKELYEAALAIDPDRLVARQGLVRVREAALARAMVDLRSRHADAARKDLALAKALSTPQVQLQPLQAQLADLEKNSGEIPAWLTEAGRPGQSEAQSLALYQQVLAVDVDNAAALAGRSELFAHRLERAQALLTSGELAAAQAIVDDVVAHDPGHLDLPAVLAQLGEAQASAQRVQARDLALAQADERRGNLVAAANRYQHLLQQASPPHEAEDGLNRCANLLAERAQTFAGGFDFRRAAEALAQARRWSPQASGIAVAERRIAQAQLREAALGAGSRSDKKRLPALLADAYAAMDREEFVAPPGVSAWDKLRIASAIAPKAAAVVRLQSDFAKRSGACFDQALGQGHLRRAQSCLEARQLALPTARDLGKSRRALADLWLANAEEQIAASDYRAAHQALAQVRVLQPRHPQLPVLEQRLHRAEGASKP
ncbi:MAG TPA: hypothetical protein VKM35_04975 [Arenimonas sp.]|uniref:hypothetical protein n=1 Tax=Arenimonas sp. TaxID=1872635 RepID=UPI002BDAD917|nr:hypothetical protein [Arenimonas sp.]HMB56543.1 hypothetical protein [Arenimonas sp.]